MKSHQDIAAPVRVFPVSELGKRIAVAVVLLPLVAVLVWQGGLWSAGLFGVAAGIATREYLRLAVPASDLGGWLTAASAATVPLLPTIAPGQALPASYAVTMGLSVVLWTYHLLRGPRPDAPARIGHMFAAVVFIAGGLFALACLRAGAAGLGWTAAASTLAGGRWGHPRHSPRRRRRRRNPANAGAATSWEEDPSGRAGGAALGVTTVAVSGRDRQLHGQLLARARQLEVPQVSRARPHIKPERRPGL